jgi:dolichol-phosphate mannosyltransferase
MPRTSSSAASIACLSGRPECDDFCTEGESLNDPIGSGSSRASGEPRFWLHALPWLTDAVIFIGALHLLRATVSAAHIASFACAFLLNYFLNVRIAVAAQGRTRDPLVYSHLLVVALAVLFLRGGVLALLIGWGFLPEGAIVFAAAIAGVLTGLGNSFCLSSRAWVLGSSGEWRVLAVGLIACAWLLRLIYSGQVEMLPEETYYWNYARHLDIGYLDHPPMVAWLIWLGTNVFGTTEFGVRFGALCAGIVASFFVYRLTRNLFDEASALVALVLMQLLPFFFFAGILMTPDAPMTAAWAALLYFLERALLAGRATERSASESPPGASAWWGVGLALGLGLLSKYTIGMLVPAMLIFIAWDAQSRTWLRNWRPYVAGLLALALFFPVIYWNATHEWASFAFQTSRRLAERPQFAVHKLILSALILLTPVGAASLAASLWSKGHAPAQALRRRRFLQLSILTPLAVFFLFSLRHEVKFDWTGALWIAAVPPLASAVASSSSQGVRAWSRRAWTPTLVTLMLIYGAAFHYFVLGLPGVGYSKHMELVPVGWRSLGEQVARIEQDIRKQTGSDPIIMTMDRYEAAGELVFYSPDPARAVSRISSDVLFGGLGLMYKRWFPETSLQGRDLLLLSWDVSDLDSAAVRSHMRRLDPVREGVLTREGHPIRHYYYRLAYDYQE